MEPVNNNDWIKDGSLYVFGWNDALEYSAALIEDASKFVAFSDSDISEFAAINAISLREAEREAQQQDFYEALEKDPEMFAKLQSRVDFLENTIKSAVDIYIRYGDQQDEMNIGKMMYDFLHSQRQWTP